MRYDDPSLRPLRPAWRDPVLALAVACLGGALLVGVSCVAVAGPLTTDVVCSPDDTCVASISGPLPIPLPIPVASGGGGTAAGAAGPWTLVNSCALTSDLLCSADDVVFARASAATCDHADGTRTNVATGVACHDATWGLRVEGTSRTNTILYSQAFSGDSWTKGSAVVALPVVTGDQATNRAGDLLADQIDLPSVQNAGEYSIVYQGFTATAASWSGAIDVKGVSGSGTVYLRMGADVTYPTTACAYTAGAWSRCEVEGSTLTAATHYLVIGVDLQAGTSQSAQPAQSVYVDAAQVELGAWSSSYNVTEASTVTRVAETATLAVTGWDVDHTRVTLTTRYDRAPQSGQSISLLDASADAASINGWRADVTSLLEARLQWGDADTWSSADGAPLSWAVGTDYAWEILAEVGDSEMLLDDASQFTAAPAAGDWPAALSTAKLGSWGVAASDMNGWFRALNIYEPTP